jgi:3-deoxy-D-manno-octulosonate 8-phosphate phosphatase (KDO 8-P phosphatase)
MGQSVEDRCRLITLLLMDVDGVLTDGGIVYSDRGTEIKAFHVRDGGGVKLWVTAGYEAGVITGRKSAIVERRAHEMGMTVVLQGADDKGAAFDGLLHERGLRPEQACFIGDDLVDVPIFRRCGLAVAVADACAEAKAHAHHVTRAAGGRGAAREVVEMILQAQGKWGEVVAPFVG